MITLQKQYQLLLKSIELLPQQIIAGRQLKIKTSLIAKIKTADNVIVCGMGGSALGFDLVRHALGSYLKKPVIINSHYHLPAFANQRSLIILASYSGSTAETINCAREANKKKFNTITVCGQAKSALAKIPTTQLLLFTGQYNPSQQPRWGIGYFIGFFIQLLTDLEWSLWPTNKITTDFINESVISDPKNKQNLVHRQLLIIAGEHLIGNAHILNNQINETAKNISYWLTLPELNHHFLEGLVKPRGLVKEKLAVIFLESSLYSPAIKKRLLLTKQIFHKNGAKVISLQTLAKNIWLDSLSTLHLGAILCYDMARWNNVDPMKIPQVDYFKQRLSHH
ncbi:MAG: hypothetical protein COX77_04295 [Candidatus Komeilibacteria bacterium CG_4_10_14_0_2_um_filter_37_10]|uniref:SIS domain-containing protein n=1 Tax=Candidatus Komeilibacteria bacterium CG_4_10_14_0_2_um_filter_37_10 TaxID=1974470 RepID=A0A2M7VDJ2_9BACT|nr:MAG: hypothetical protein COX77_04295 [Candidatus Komeilibacteria bacterium CG_4_10_14_0_2_um_filter_37_10]PJA92453.1 MAG: hypothetical protein CO133_03135 [Candidatus Komeilibacteria bacterium CG_4_9_14_3_um_filter_37_5]